MSQLRREKINYLINKFKNKNDKDIIDRLKILLSV